MISNSIDTRTACRMSFAISSVGESPCTSAMQRLQELASTTSGEAMVLRLTVEGGGCSGYTYNFTLESETRPDDRHAPSTHVTSRLVDAPDKSWECACCVAAFSQG